MKLTNLAVIFSLIAISLFVIIDIRVNTLSAMTTKKIEYNQALDNAIDDGLIDLVKKDSDNNFTLQKEKAVEIFYNSLYANFGAMGDSNLQEKLKEHIPIILVTDTDGYYIYYTDTYEQDGETLLCRRWSEKLPYVYEDGDLIYRFTLNSYVTIYDKASNQVSEGEYKDLKDLYPGSIMTDEETFDTYRRSAIIGELEKSMNYYINHYNDFASQFGITYQFWLPQVDKTDWYRTIDDISMFVLFQGYPYNAGNLDTYNRYVFGGARIKKSKVYYITEASGVKYYHKADCSLVTDKSISYHSKEECAKEEKAFPCLECNP